MFQSKANSYAFLALAEVADRGHPGLQAQEVSAKYELPTAYAAKVMSQLAKARILFSDRGPRGGFRLARPPKEITALDVFEAMNGPLFGGAMLPSDAPKGLQRGVNQVFDLAVQDLRKRLSGVTLADVIAGRGKKR